MGIVEDTLGGPSVFKDLGKLDFDYVPPELPGRDEAVRFLTQTYRSLLQGGQKEHAFLWGPVGSGKTVVAKRFAQDFRAALHRQGRALEVSYVNCRTRKSSGLALLGILRQFDPGYPERGFSTGEMLQDLRRHLERRTAHLLIILDEVDALIRAEGSDLVYDLTRFGSEAGPTWCGISILMISQENVLGNLDAAALSTFKQTNQYAMTAYDVGGLEAIVHQRVQLAFHAGAVAPDLETLVADVVSAQGGNARLAIEVLQKAGRIADEAGKREVSAEMVRSAKADSYSYITVAKLQNMGRHPLLVLLALARRLKKGDAYVTTGDTESAYKVACEEFGEEPRAHTQFWKYLKQLQDGGFILSRLSGKGHAGTTQLLSIPDAPAAAVEAKVTEWLGP